ncbi:TPA: fimbrial protein [Citrobacter freundii]
MSKIITRNGIVFIIGGLSLFFALSADAVNVTFDGELVDRPCQIEPSSLDQTVHFLERPAKDFWKVSAKSPTESFSIRLINCNTTSFWKTVKLKFTGDFEMNMLGQSDYFLKVTGVNQGKLAVGILDTDGLSPLKLGEMHNKGQGVQINGSILQLNFKAFVQATPDAIAKRSVQPGEYSSVANFELFYE